MEGLLQQKPHEQNQNQSHDFLEDINEFAELLNNPNHATKYLSLFETDGFWGVLSPLLHI